MGGCLPHHLRAFLLTRSWLWLGRWRILRWSRCRHVLIHLPVMGCTLIAWINRIEVGARVAPTSILYESLILPVYECIRRDTANFVVSLLLVLGHLSCRSPSLSSRRSVSLRKYQLTAKTVRTSPPAQNNGSICSPSNIVTRRNLCL